MGNHNIAEGTQVGVVTGASFGSAASLGQHAKMPKEMCRNARRNSKVIGQRGCRVGKRLEQSRLLQSFFCGAKKGRRKVAINFGPQSAKSVHRKREIQDGYSRDHQGTFASGGMGNIVGFDRRLQAHPNSCSFSKIPTVWFQPASLPVQDFTYGPHHITQGVYQSDQVHHTVSPQTFNTGTSVSGRLADTCRFQSQDAISHKDSSRVDQAFRFYCQPRQVGAGTFTRPYFPSLPVSPGQGIDLSHGKQVTPF